MRVSIYIAIQKVAAACAVLVFLNMGWRLYLTMLQQLVNMETNEIT